MHPGLRMRYLAMSDIGHPMADLTGNQKPDQAGGRPSIDLDSMKINARRKLRDSGLTFTSTTSWKGYTKINRL